MTRFGKLLVVLLSSFLFGQIANATSFDCSKAIADIDKAICHDVELSKIDKVMAEVFAAAKQDLGNTALVQAQKFWIQDRNFQCLTIKDARTACLYEKYFTRIQELWNKPQLLVQYDCNHEKDTIFIYYK